MATISVSGVPIYYELTGGGTPTLCLVHGSGGSTAAWIRQLEGLADTARVIALDLPGHGRSGGRGSPTIGDYVATVRAFAESLELETFVLGGHSMGGAIAQAFALAHPDRLAGLVLVGTGARLRVLPRIFELLQQEYPDGVRFVIQLAVSAGASAELRDALFQQTVRTPQAVLLGDFRACDAFDAMERVRAIAVPTLVICGTEDQLTPPKYAHFLRGRIPGARLALIPGAGHYVQLERPDETTEAMREFLAALRHSLPGRI